MEVEEAKVEEAGQPSQRGTLFYLHFRCCDKMPQPKAALGKSIWLTVPNLFAYIAGKIRQELETSHPQLRARENAWMSPCSFSVLLKFFCPIQFRNPDPPKEWCYLQCPPTLINNQDNPLKTNLI